MSDFQTEGVNHATPPPPADATTARPSVSVRPPAARPSDVHPAATDQSVADDDAAVAVADWARRVGERWASTNRAAHHVTPADAARHARSTPLIAAAAVSAQIRQHDAGEAYAAEGDPEDAVHRFDIVAPIEAIPGESTDGHSRGGRHDERASRDEEAADEEKPHVDVKA